ncbi:MAG: hypothetical protein ACI3VS_08725 [Evtepia sp.]
MKKLLKIILVILVLLVIAVAALAIWQRDNLTALRDGMNMDPSAIQVELDSSREEFADTMDQYGVPQKEFTQEEIDRLVRGEITPEELADAMLQNSGGTASSAGQTTGGQTSAQQPSAGPNDSLNEAIRKEIATMYVLRASYEGKLDAIVESAREAYNSGQNKQSILLDKLNELTALEKECDQQVAEVTSRLRELLAQAGQDTAIADQVEETYQAEKSMKKAYYVQKFQNG